MRNFSVLVILAFSLLSCKKDIKMDVQGHRGARGMLPENSLPAFEKAIELGVTTLELDVVISKDNKVVVSHEPFMNHEICLNPDGDEILEEDEKSLNLFQMNYAEIKTFDCGTKLHSRFPQQENLKVYKPLLSEVFKLSEEKTQGKIKYNIEIKSDSTYDGVYSPEIHTFVALVLKVVEQFSLKDRVTLQSFDIRALEQINQQSPNMVTALLVDIDENIEDKLSSLSFKPTIISPDYLLLNAQLVKSFQKQGYEVIPWTVNEENDINKVISYGVDGIITDFPDRLIRLLDRK